MVGTQLKWLAGREGLVSWGSSAGSLYQLQDFFIRAEVALMCLFCRTSLVSVKTSVLLSCFPRETLAGSIFLLYLAIYFHQTCKNWALGHIGSCQWQFDSVIIRRNTCTNVLLPKLWNYKSFSSVANQAKKRPASGNKELIQVNYEELCFPNHIRIAFKWTADKIRENCDTRCL